MQFQLIMLSEIFNQVNNNIIFDSAARLAILSPEFVDSGELEPLLAIRNFFWLSEKFWLNSGYFVKMDFTCHESL